MFSLVTEKEISKVAGDMESLVSKMLTQKTSQTFTKTQKLRKTESRVRKISSIIRD